MIESGGQNTLGPRLSPPGPAAAAPSVEQGLQHARQAGDDLYSSGFTEALDRPQSLPTFVAAAAGPGGLSRGPKITCGLQDDRHFRTHPVLWSWLTGVQAADTLRNS